MIMINDFPLICLIYVFFLVTERPKIPGIACSKWIFGVAKYLKMKINKDTTL